jgi:hypothetical protein
MKDCYIWFLIVCILVTGCIVSYKSGYADGYKLGITLCPAIQHNDPQDQNTSIRPEAEMTPQGVK